MDQNFFGHGSQSRLYKYDFLSSQKLFGPIHQDILVLVQNCFGPIQMEFGLFFVHSTKIV